MSIFVSLPAPDDEHSEDCGIWTEHACTCGQPDAPLVYQGSHILPSDSDRRGGYVDIALIPAHVRYWREHPDAPVATEPEEPPEPFLRLGVNNETVILTRRNVKQVADTLNGWLRRTEAAA